MIFYSVLFGIEPHRRLYALALAANLGFYFTVLCLLSLLYRADAPIQSFV